MRIRTILVKDLFGIFNHVIPLNLDEKVTIIHGPNGFGKTIILTMLHHFFNGEFNIFTKIPFEEFSINFDDNRCISIKKNKIDNELGSQEGDKVTLKLTVELLREGHRQHFRQNTL